MRIATNQIHNQAVDIMLQQQTKLTGIQEQLATGKRVNKPSDDPIASTLSLDMQAAKSSINQFTSNITYAENRLRITESTLANVTTLYQRVRELAVQALNDSNDAVARGNIGDEVKVLFDSMLSLVNSTDGAGEYLFAGTATETRPFVWTAGTGVQYQGNVDERSLQIGKDSTVQVTENGSNIFLKVDNGAGGTQDIFSLIDQFHSELTDPTDPNYNNPSATILSSIDSAMDQVAQSASRLGARLNATERQLDALGSNVAEVDIALSSLVDLDYASAITNLNLTMAGLQASQQTYQRVQGLSLFNYL